MSNLSVTFSAAGISSLVHLNAGESMNYALAVASEETFDGNVNLVATKNGGQTYDVVAAFTGEGSGTYVAEQDVQLAFQCTAFNEGSDNIVCTLASVADTIKEFVNEAGTSVLSIKDDGIETPKITASAAALSQATIGISALTTTQIGALTATQATIGVSSLSTTQIGSATVTSLTGMTTFALANDVHTLQGAGAPVDYTDGDPAATGEGVAGKGSTYVDTTNGKLYINGGTKAQPLWKIVTSA